MLVSRLRNGPDLRRVRRSGGKWYECPTYLLDGSFVCSPKLCGLGMKTTNENIGSLFSEILTVDEMSKKL